MTAQSFAQGVNYVFKGIGRFYSRPKLWLYALVPFIIVMTLYTLLFAWLFYDIMPWVTSYADNAQGFRGWFLTASGFLLKFITGIIFILAAALFASSLFEMTGAMFFAYMVRAFEKTEYPQTPHQYPDFSQDILNTINCIIFSSLTAIIFILLSIIGIFIPLIPFLLSVVFIGYRYSISYCSESSFNRGRTIWNSHNYFEDKGILYGFGSMVFLILMIPFISIFLIPGFVVGGAMMINEKT